MEQTKALNALEVRTTQSHALLSLLHTDHQLIIILICSQPFLALTKTATSSRAAADLVSRATSAPGTFIFSELLAQPPIAALAEATEPEFRAWHTHLTIFSHGLYTTYTTSPDLPALTPPQQLKLRQLSLLTLSRDKANLTYPSLQKHLGLSSSRELENIVISAINAGLVTAKLNPARQEVQVSSVAPLRDVPPSTVQGIVRTLQQWSARCDATLAELEDNVAKIRAEAARSEQRRREAERIVQAAVEAEEKSTGANGSGLAEVGGGPGSRLRGGPRRAHISTIANLRSHMGSAGIGASAGGGSKRGSEKLMESMGGADDDDEAMDLDDDAEVGQKRASRRKL